MRISNIEWLKKRIGFIRKLGEQTARQRQIIDLLDNEAGLTEQERKLLHVLATAEKNDLQAQESERKQAVQKRIEGKKQRRERNHRLFLAAGLLIEAGLVETGLPHQGAPPLANRTMPDTAEMRLTQPQTRFSGFLEGRPPETQ